MDQNIGQGISGKASVFSRASTRHVECQRQSRSGTHCGGRAAPVSLHAWNQYTDLDMASTQEEQDDIEPTLGWAVRRPRTAVRASGTVEASPSAQYLAVQTPEPEQSFRLDLPWRDARNGFEKQYFEFHVAQEDGNLTRVAETTGLDRAHLYRKLTQLGVDLRAKMMVSPHSRVGRTRR